MKKLFLAAGLFLALTVNVNAQERRDDQRQRPTTEQQMKKFDGMNLSNSQKQKLQALYKERDAKFSKNRMAATKGKPDANQKAKMEKERNDFDKKIQKILTKEQYAKFKDQHAKMGFRAEKSAQPGFRARS